jgi:hypothetical protein
MDFQKKMKNSTRKKFLCLDCGIDTGKAYEHYFVHNEVWDAAHSSREGMLCIGCLEARLGRTLTRQDFPYVSINSPFLGLKSQRFIQRLFDNNTKKT